MQGFVLIVTAIVGWHTTMLVYLFTPCVLLPIVGPPFYFVMIVVLKLRRAQVDRRASAFLDSRPARWLIAWLRYVSINFAHVEGDPLRWYHVFRHNNRR